jgi:hypothetical protein
VPSDTKRHEPQGDGLVMVSRAKYKMAASSKLKPNAEAIGNNIALAHNIKETTAEMRSAEACLAATTPSVGLYSVLIGCGKIRCQVPRYITNPKEGLCRAPRDLDVNLR